MPPFPSRQQTLGEELPEFSQTGPFGGIQSQVPRDLIEQFGFSNVLNMIFRLGRVTVRPSYDELISFTDAGFPPEEDIYGIFDFFTSDAVRIQTVTTPTRLFEWTAGQTWQEILPGGYGPLTGTTELFSFTTVNGKELFSQGIDPVMLWDGVTANFDIASPDAVPAKYLMELQTHLLAAYTFEGGSYHPQRIRWTAAGDPTDWVSFDSGVVDLLNDLGPITGMVKLYQAGYAMHQWGITQIIPTGIAAAPFNFFPLTSKARGCIAPFSIAYDGEELAAYVGKDNIYSFNGSTSTPIGDMPIDGRRRIGAREVIFGDILLSDPTRLYGFLTNSINGHPFSAYWLAIPSVAVWVYNFDEQNWTRFTYANPTICIGEFFHGGVIRIEDLIGTIAQQSWTPATLASSNPFEDLLISFENNIKANIDFTNYSEQPWAVSQPIVMGDARHSKTVKKFRITIQDQGEVTFTVTVANTMGLSQTKTVTMGTGSGDDVAMVVAFNVPGIRLNWTVAGGPAEAASFIEFCPIYQTGGEQRGGIVDS